MILPDSSVRNENRKGSRSSLGRLRDKRRRKDRRLLSEALEQRQLLAGPDLVGIQPNEGALIRGGEVLNVSPRELIFRFDDQTDLDPLTVANGIAITRAGADRGFESATGTSDLGTGGVVLLEFRAAESGARGNGIEVRMIASDRGTSSQAVNVNVSQDDRIITLDLNSNPNRPSVVRDVIRAVETSPEASALIDVDQVSGASLSPVGTAIGNGIEVLLAGANAAQFVTDLGTSNPLSSRFISTISGTEGVGTTIQFSRSNLNLGPGQLPFVSVSGKTISVTLDSTPGNESTVNDLIAALNSDSVASNLVFAQLEYGDGSQVISDFSPLTLVGASDTPVEPGYVGLGDTPHEVVFRFAEDLPEDTYQIEVFGSGPLALRNVEGEPFADGTDFGVQFSLNNAPQVAAVVPTPVRRQSDGSLSPELNVIDVYFNEPVANAADPTLYELVYTRDSVSNLDDVVIQPDAVVYDAVNRLARLEFSTALSRFRDPLDNTKFLDGSARLRIGTDRDIPDAPSVVNVNTEPGDSFDGAFQLGSNLLNSSSGAIESLKLSGEIDNPEDYGLDFPGGSDVPGVRNIRPDDPTRVDRTVPLDVWRVEGDVEDGISTIFYDFKDSWLGDDPNRGLDSRPELDLLYRNLITDQQKQRIREVLSLYSEYLGIQFVETNGVPLDDAGQPLTNNRYFAIAVGELSGAGSDPPANSDVGGVTVATRPLDEFGNTFLHDQFDADNDPANPLNSGNQLLIMDQQDFDASVDDQLGGEFFRGGFLGVGQLLGYGFADHLPQPVTQSTASVLNPGDENEPSFPSPSDIVNGLYLHRPESNDVDLYQFRLDRPGKINIQTVAERLRSASSLDTALRLYQNVDGAWREVAANDDYFSNDSLIELDLQSGDYMVGVSSTGNTVYDPIIPGTGIGGRSEGAYELNITFEADGARVIVDQTLVKLDGDMDGRAGGEYNFWFTPSDPVNTIYVDKAFQGERSGPAGIASNPYRNIDDAIADAADRISQQTGDLVKMQVRVVGGGIYQVGVNNRGSALADGANIELPRGVQLVLDAGSTFRMRGSRIGVGSTSEAPTADRSETSIQVLGIPGLPVQFTSDNSTPRPGDWGGIDLRGDLDAGDDSRVNLEDEGIFLNHIQYADIRYGGGPVSISGRPVIVNPINMDVTRPTIVNSRISDSGDAALAASPDTFAVTRFDEERFQRAGAFTPDVRRIGPHIRGNEIVDNTINGLFVRIDTPVGGELETLRVNARFDDTDVVHVLTENLLIEGQPGGANASLSAPSVSLVRSFNTTEAGDIAAGTYRYRITFVDRNGYETEASEATVNITAGVNGAIQLTGLPVVPADSEFVGRRLYRANVNSSGNSGPFLQVARLNTSDTTFTDTAANGTIPIVPDNVRIGRIDPSLVIDPGTVIKMQESRIDVTLGAHLYAEGTESQPIVLTSLSDNRFGAGGSFDTSSIDREDATVSPGDWGGIYVAFGGQASLDHATLAGGGGETTIEGGFGSFNAIEVHQGDLRVANSRFEQNADGRNFVNDDDDVRAGRVGRGDNASGTIFARASQPVLINNDFVDGNGPVMTFDINSFTSAEEVDQGRNTGFLDALVFNGNSGPLIQGNRIGTTRLNQLDPDDPENRNYSCGDALGQNPIFDQDGDPIFCSLNGVEVRGGKVATEVVLDDVDIVHIVRDTIEVPNQHIYGGLRLQSDARGSLVVKFQNQEVEISDIPDDLPDADIDDFLTDTMNIRQAGIVVGGTLITAEDEFLDIDDRIGGSLQVVGHPDYPVVLTALSDDTVGAGYTTDGRSNIDTDNNGQRLDANGDPIVVLTSDTDAGPPPPPLLPLGEQYDRTDREEVDNANLIDNDIDPAVVGFLEAEIEYGGQILDDVRFTYLNDNPGNPADGPIGPLQLTNVEFLYTTYIDVDVFFPFANPAPIRLADTMGAGAGPNPILIGDDFVRSTGTFILDQGTIDPTDPRNVAPNVPRRIVDWTAESFILNSRDTIYTTLNFTTRDGGAFTDGIVSDVQVISYLDQGIDADDEDILYSVGDPGQPDFRAMTINRDPANRDLGPLIGFSHGGIYENDNFNQINAEYLGWAADNAGQLLNRIQLETPNATYSVNGNVDTQVLVPSGDPLFDGVTPGTVARGEDDIATAFAWRLDPGEDESRVTSFVSFLPSDPVNPFQPTLPPAIDGAGTWDGVTIREAASDSNVAVTSENEPANLGNIEVNDTNPIPTQSQFLGFLASDLSSGDNNQRLGFIVDGTIAQPGDLDVYTFSAKGGTQVWIDIDRTNSRLDTVVELIDVNGFVRVLSDDSISEAKGDTDRLIGPGGFTASSARPLGTKLIADGSPDSAYQDLYSTNPRDAGMRLVLPGTIDVQNDYHIRVRSANSAVSGDASLVDPSQVRGGLTTGAYQLQIRLDETDVFAGTQVRYGDVRFAVNGVQIVGGPNHSPILADEYEKQSPNDTISGAQRLGLYETLYDAPVTVGGQILDSSANPQPIPGLSLGLRDTLLYDRVSGQGDGADVTLQNPASPLSSDRLAKSVAGILDGSSDVDWYQFDIEYKKLSRDAAALHLSTVFDLDYADGMARADTSIYVFDENRQLVLIGTDSNIADDQQPEEADEGDLSRGSYGTGDPFIGAAELSEGTYFVAVSNQDRVPVPLSQYFDVDTTNPLVRLEPIDSITRIVEDRIYRTSVDGPVDDTGNYDANGDLISLAGGAVIDEDGFLRDRSTGELLLIDGQPRVAGGGTATPPKVPVLFDDNSILEHSFDDVVLYVNTNNNLHIVNPMTGELYLGGSSLGSFGGELINDVAFRANGELFGFTDNRPAADASTEYVRIDTSNAGLNVIGPTGVQTFHLTDPAPTNVLLETASDDGIQVEAISIREANGAERGYLVANRPVDRPGLAYFTNMLYSFDETNGQLDGFFYDQSRFNPGAGTSRREIGQIETLPPANAQPLQLGITDATIVDGGGVARPSLVDGDTFVLSDVTDVFPFEFDQGFTIVVDGSQPVRDGDTIIIDGQSFEFNTGSRIELSDVSPLGLLSEGATVTVVGENETVTYEFVRFSAASGNNTPIDLVDQSGTPRPIGQVAADLAADINANITGVVSQAIGGEVYFSSQPQSLTSSGPGVSIVGDNDLADPTAVEIAVSGTLDPELLVGRLADAIRNSGKSVSDAGTQLALPGAVTVSIQPDPTDPLNPASAFALTGAPGVTAGNVPILLLPTDTVSTIAQRISIAVQAVSDEGPNRSISAIPNGHSLNIVGGFVVSASGNLTAGGLPTGGLVTGIEIVNDDVFAVTNTGGLFQVTETELNSGNGNSLRGPIGRYVSTATDLVGINFSGLRAGPVSVENGSLSQILFGITSDGDIHAFNTRGELQPIFAGGQSVISTGITGAEGLDFSVVDFSLWHVTGQRGSDPGHGVNQLFNDARLGRVGSSSLAFTYEDSAFGGNYPSVVERPTFAARQDGAGFEDTYNVPGGAKGVVQSNEFSLEGYASEDLPMLYFNYYSETQATGGLDALRVHVVTADGIEHLVATNNFNLGPGIGDDEFDDPDPASNPVYANPDNPSLPDDIDVDTQRLFDTTNSVNDTWRQARISLSEFAGQSGLSLRIEFATSGTPLTTSDSLRVISGKALAESSEREFVINDSSSGIGGQSFVIDMAPTISFPSGLQLATLYSDPTAVSVITLDGQDYVLNDGTRPIAPGQIQIHLLANMPSGTQLADLSSEQIAAAVATQVQATAPPNPLIENFNFSDPSDNPALSLQRNDFLYEATPLPYSGGNLTLTGSGRLGTIVDPAQPPTNLDDVDLLRVNVAKDSLIEVDVDLDFNTALNAAIRFFDSLGNEVQGIANPANDTVQYTAPSDGIIYIGISGLGNESYDPRIPGSAQVGQIDSYTASVNITQASAIRADGNVVEFVGGQQSFSASPAELFTVTERTDNENAIPIGISRFMSVSEVATEIQRAIADRFTAGNTDLIPTDGPSVRLPNFFIDDTGPLRDEIDRYGANRSFRAGTANNNFEGTYLDDFVIGFAERGEMVTSANALPAADPIDPNDPNDPNAQFIANGSRQLTNPPQPAQSTTRGAYQLEIRDGSEYITSSSISVIEPELDFFSGQPLGIPVSGVVFGVPVGFVPVGSIIPTNQSPFPQLGLPTVDILLDGQGNPVTAGIGQNLFAFLTSDGSAIPLIELDANLEPVPSTFTPIANEARFRTFDTNDRLANGFTLEAMPATQLIDGATFTIFDSLNQLNFEFDIADPSGQFNGLNDPNAIVIEVPAEATAEEVASQVIDTLNSQRDSLDLEATRGNTTTPQNGGMRDFLDNRINIYGNISFNELSPAFASVTSFDLRGDSNRDRDEQGVIVIENSRFLFNSDSGVAITRDAEARVMSLDERDEFPVALTYPANLIELNTEGLVPGVVVQNNVLAFNANNGIFISGIDRGGGAINNPVGYDLIINNTVVGGVIEPGVDLGSQIFSGFLFEKGGISFADEIDRDSLNLGNDVDSAFTDTVAALSSPDGTGRGNEPEDGEFTLSLGTGGQAVFRFTDNFLTGNDSPTPDLVIFETGASETVRVEISRDGEVWEDVGTASGINPTIDIDARGHDSNDRFAFVRLTDEPNQRDEPTPAFGAAGADIDAVGALSTVPAERYTPGAQGIFVTQNAAPTLANNIVANFQTGIAVTPPSSDPRAFDVDISRDLTVIGYNSYFRNAFDAIGTDNQSLGVASQTISDFEQIFVDATGLVFTPQQGVRTIDSSNSDLDPRPSLETVRGAIELPPVSILAPIYDLNGQERNEPGGVPPTGVGFRELLDRGAEERSDTTGPRLTLITPRADDLLIDSGRAFTVGTVFDSFDIQLVDGIQPADSGPGVGINDGSVSGSLIRVTRLESGSDVTETLVEGVDYRFAYEPADNKIRLTPIAGIWQDNSVYTVQFLGNEVGILQGDRGTEYADGALTQVDRTVSDRRAIEADTGIGISIATSALTIEQGGAQVPNIEGQTVEIFDGRLAEPLIFELTTDNDNIDIIRENGRVPVRVGERATANQIAAALAIEINQSTVKLFATAVGNRIQLRDSVIKASDAFEVHGAAAYFGADVSLSPDTRGLIVEGETLTVFDGTAELTFTLTLNASLVNDGSTAVVVSPSSRVSEIFTAVKQQIDQSGLAVSATVADGVLQLRGLSDRVDSDTALSFARPGTSGNPLDDAFKLTNYSLDVVLTDATINAVDGASITIFDGSVERTFEFDNVVPPAGVPAVLPGNLVVAVGPNPTARELLTALRQRIERTELNVQIVDAARSFRITGTQAPISVVSESDSFDISGFGMIGTSPGFGIGIPADGLDLDESVDDAQSFTITRGPNSETFEIDFDGNQDIEDSTLVPVQERTLDAVADAIVLAINQSQFGLVAENIGGGRVTLSGIGTEDVNLNLTDSAFVQLGIAGLPTPAPVVIPINADEAEIAAAYSEAFIDLNVAQELIGDRVIVEGLEALRGTSVVEDRISDEVSNQAFLGELVIFVGGGLDYGDAPAPYASTAAQGGPRHTVDERFALWRPNPADPNDRPITPDPDAPLPNLDEDNGVRLVTPIQPGFKATFDVGVHNTNNRSFFLDAWFDWDGDGLFEVDEVSRYRFSNDGNLNNDTIRPGNNQILVDVPNDAVTGEIYARFRLSEVVNLGPTGDADSGEVEDLRLTIESNPYQNPQNRHDVNNSNVVTPLDALNVINAIGRNGGNSIPLDVFPLPTNLPAFPDVSGDGRVSVLDALQVINELNRINANSGSAELIGEGEAILGAATNYVPTQGGVFATVSTLLGNPNADAVESEEARAEEYPELVDGETKASIFDAPAVMALESIVDDLAEDTANNQEEGSINGLDAFFAGL